MYKLESVEENETHKIIMKFEIMGGFKNKIK